MVAFLCHGTLPQHMLGNGASQPWTETSEAIGNPPSLKLLFVRVMERLTQPVSMELSFSFHETADLKQNSTGSRETGIRVLG